MRGLTGILVYEAMNRLTKLNQLDVDGKSILIVGSKGLFIHSLFGIVLHEHSSPSREVVLSQEEESL